MQQIIGICHHWTEDKAGQGRYELRWMIEGGYYTQEELEKEKNAKATKTWCQPKQFQPPPKPNKQGINWLKHWYENKELQQAFNNNFSEMIEFAKWHGYGSPQPSTMSRHIRDMIRHKKVQEQLKLT